MNKFISLSLVMAGILFLPAYQLTKENIKFEDDFSDNRNNWDQHDDGVSMYRIYNGKYIMELRENRSSYRSRQNITVAPDEDFIIETTARSISGHEYFYGIFWERDWQLSYTFEISPSGVYAFYKNIGYVQNNMRYISEGSNKLTIEKSGDIMKFYINDQFVNEVPYEGFSINKIGLQIGGRLAVEFDSFVVKGKTAAAPTWGDTPQVTILPYGVVELRFPDGTVRYRYKGEDVNLSEDGHPIVPFVGAMPATPPKLPTDKGTRDWLDGHCEELLDIIKSLVSGDSQAINNYLQYEQESVENPNRVYDKISIRTQTIYDLLYPLMSP
ncbi:MAG: hypothetical protein ACE5NG_05730 [bacterium]